MTIQEAINWVDEKKHNVYSREDKLVWISKVEAMAEDLAARYGIKVQSPIATGNYEDNLLIPAPYDQLYLRWLEAQIDYTNQEYLKYNNAIAVFNTLWKDYANWFCRNHVHPDGRFRFF